jgi:hypothetical protein
MLCQCNFLNSEAFRSLQGNAAVIGTFTSSRPANSESCRFGVERGSARDKNLNAHKIHTCGDSVFLWGRPRSGLICAQFRGFSWYCPPCPHRLIQVSVSNYSILPDWWCRGRCLAGFGCENRLVLRPAPGHPRAAFVGVFRVLLWWLSTCRSNFCGLNE